MASKKIQEQVNELTEDQKISILENGKKALTFMSVVLAITIVVLAIWIFFSQVAVTIAENNYDMLGEKLNSTSAENMIDPINEWLKAGDVYFALVNICTIVSVVIPLSGFIIIVVRLIQLKKKCPLYSDRKYFFLKKEQKMKQLSLKK